MFLDISEIKIEGYEQVLLGIEPECDYRCIIAVHNTSLGPALGGTRLWSYQDDHSALIDALRLSRGMTYKNAMAGVPFGGGKSVILAPDQIRSREALFRAHGKFIETFRGKYFTGEDVGTGVADMDFVRLETKFVAGLSQCSGDPSPFTARGVFRGIQASANFLWDSDDLSGKSVSLQGCGHVGYNLAGELHSAGTQLFAADIDEARLARVVTDFHATPCDPREIISIATDIFAPCGLGGVLGSEALPILKSRIVAGAANNQLLTDEHGDRMRELGILYAPDYVINAGGVISGLRDLLGIDLAEVQQRVDEIYSTTVEVFQTAEQAGISTNRAADMIAERRLAKAVGNLSSQPIESAPAIP